MLLPRRATSLEALVSGGTAILNADDLNFESIYNKFSTYFVGKPGKIVTYGFGERAEVRASNEHILYDEESKKPTGLTFKLDAGGKSIPIRMPGIYGKHHIYIALAALAVAEVLELNMIQVGEALMHHETPPGRFKLIEGIKDTLILDDTYNSSPAALEAALSTLGEIEVTGRKIAVLGDMMELGSYTIEAHKSAGVLAAKVCDVLYTVGLRAKFIGETAVENKFNAKNWIHFDDAVEAGKKLQQILKPGDIVLVKGSQIVRLEKTVEEIMLHPELKNKLLTRQYEEWVASKK
jgi:UDP-N-acetylmuramoyl-tripeptide--D-alanyl-D-alanine ligase